MQTSPAHAVREARPADAAAIARVHVDSWRTTYRGIIADEFLAALSTERREQMWRHSLMAPAPQNALLVAESGSEGIVGFVAAGPEREGDHDYRAEIYALYVLQPNQGQGIGRALVTAVVGALHRHQLTSLLVWVLRDNPARGFYEALGGRWLRDKPIEIGSQQLIESAYGWPDTTALGPASS